jgi:hypothetical protein
MPTKTSLASGPKTSAKHPMPAAKAEFRRRLIIGGSVVCLAVSAFFIYRFLAPEPLSTGGISVQSQAGTTPANGPAKRGNQPANAPPGQDKAAGQDKDKTASGGAAAGAGSGGGNVTAERPRGSGHMSAPAK